MTTRARQSAATCLIAVLGFAAAVHAEPVAPTAPAETSAERARALFKEGRRLVTEGHYEEGCSKFEESLHLDEGLGTKFNLADCWEHLGKGAGASALFREVAQRSRESGQLDREKVALERAEAALKKAGKLTIGIAGGVSGLEVRRDGAVVEPSEWNRAEPVDPGRYEIIVSAPGRKTWSTHVDVPKTGGDVSVDVPALEDVGVERKAEPKGKKVEKKAAAPVESVAAPDEPARDSTLQIALFATAGAGAVLAGTALALYSIKNGEAKEVCPTSVNCTMAQVDRHEELVRDAKSARGLAFFGVGVGGAALIGATLATFIRPVRPPAGSARFDAAPLLGPGVVGAAASGSF